MSSLQIIHRFAIGAEAGGKQRAAETGMVGGETAHDAPVVHIRGDHVSEVLVAPPEGVSLFGEGPGDGDAGMDEKQRSVFGPGGVALSSPWIRAK